MADQLQFRGGTTAENLLFTGAQREVVVDTDTNSLRVHDGITQGGFAVPTEAMITDGTIYFNEDLANGSAANAYILAPKVNTNVPTSYLDGVQLGFVTTTPNTGPSTADFSGLGVRNIKFPGGIDPSAGDISGRVNLVYDAANGWLELQKKPAAAQPQIRAVGASVGGNALTVQVSPAVIDFRSPTLTSGVINSRNLTSLLSLVVPAGATLGTTNGVLSRIAILAIDNAGTVVPAVVNVSGTTNLDETQLINTTAISAAASSANVVYAASSISGVPFRVMGYVASTQSVAGTWQSLPALVQGQGGQAIIGLKYGLGEGQTLQNLTASRATATNYTNTTGRTIYAIIRMVIAAGATSDGLLDGSIVSTLGNNGTGGTTVTHLLIIKADQVYRINGGTITTWFEMRT